MVTKLNLHDLQGKSIKDALSIASEKVQKAQDLLAESHQLYSLCSKQKVDQYTRGQIRQKLWSIEHAMERNQLFLSQAGQDKAVYERFFENKRDGVFVEIGGFDGWMGSNCFFFEKVLGWNGVVVEASPARVENIRKVRSARVVHAAISNYDGETDFLEIESGYLQMGGLMECYSEDLLEKVRKHPKHRERIVKVPVMKLETLLETQGIEKIDYCSIDVEGAERQILESVDLEKLDIQVYTIENNAGNESNSIRDVMEPAGYELVDVVGVDEVYAKA